MVDLDGYEGPLHVLLALARTQKVDLLKLSITKLAEQYLAFVHEARRRNFSLAADYLVMASWLAYLKSRLLLPRTEKGKGDEPPAEEMAAALAFRLQKLEAMRKAVRGPAGPAAAEAGRLHARRSRGDGDRAVRPDRRQPVRADGGLCRPSGGASRPRHYNPGQRVEAYRAGGGARLAARDPAAAGRVDAAGAGRAASVDGEGPSQASLTASTLSASLELVKEGAMDVRQDAGLRRGLAEAARAGSGAGADAMSGIQFAPDDGEIERRVEALLFAAAGPLSAAEIARRLPEGADVGAGHRGACATAIEGRGVELECVADRWRFRTAADLAFLMTEEREEPRRLSKAALETLAIIAYHQPVTRAEIESVRGVSMSRGTLDLLLEMGFVRLRGRRRTPGPAGDLCDGGPVPGAFRPGQPLRPAGRGGDEGGGPAGPVAAGRVRGAGPVAVGAGRGRPDRGGRCSPSSRRTSSQTDQDVATRVDVLGASGYTHASAAGSPRGFSIFALSQDARP